MRAFTYSIRNTYCRYVCAYALYGTQPLEDLRLYMFHLTTSIKQLGQSDCRANSKWMRQQVQLDVRISRSRILVVLVANFLGFPSRSIDSSNDDLSYIICPHVIPYPYIYTVSCRAVSVRSYYLVSCRAVLCRVAYPVTHTHRRRGTHRARSVRTVYSSRTDARRRFQLATQKDGSPFISFRDYRIARRSAVTPRRRDVDGPPVVDPSSAVKSQRTTTRATFPRSKGKVASTRCWYGAVRRTLDPQMRERFLLRE